MNTFNRIGILGVASVFAGVAILIGVAPSLACGGSGCGIYRWAVKTIAAGTEPSPWHTATATVAQMNALTQPSPYPGKYAGRVDPVEQTIYTIDACLFGLTYQGDQDYHIMINDLSTTSKTMVIEVPSGTCAKACSSPYTKNYEAIRTLLETSSHTRALVRKLHEQFNALNKVRGEAARPAVLFLTVPDTIRTVGAGFWDSRHHKVKGSSDNYVELHPIVQLTLGSTTCSTPPPKTMRAIMAQPDDDE